jgi:hypothetical protein
MISKKVLFIHVRGFQDIERFASFMPFLDGLEIKPEDFRQNDALFYWQGERLKYNNENFQRLVTNLNDRALQIQFHLPYEIEGRILDIADREHHALLFNVFETYAEVMIRFGFGRNITVHPPELNDHSDKEAVRNALSVTNDFLVSLGEKIKKNKWPIVIGLENQPDPAINNYSMDMLGYKLKHFMRMLYCTNEFIQLTVDSGHRLLATDFKVRDLEMWCKDNGKYIANMHFHENEGISPERIETGKSLDLHALALPDGRVLGFSNYLLRAIADNVPLNLEIKTKEYSLVRLYQYIAGLRSNIDQVYEQISGQ